MNLLILITMNEFQARGWFEVSFFLVRHACICVYYVFTHLRGQIASLMYRYVHTYICVYIFGYKYIDLILLSFVQEPKAQNFVDHGVGTQNMLQLTPHAGLKPFKSVFDWGSIFPYVAQVVRSEKFDYRQVSTRLWDTFTITINVSLS